MENKVYMECAGNLYEELEEINKISPGDEILEIDTSHSVGCGGFFTIYCC